MKKKEACQKLVAKVRKLRNKYQKSSLPSEQVERVLLQFRGRTTPLAAAPLTGHADTARSRAVLRYKNAATSFLLGVCLPLAIVILLAAHRQDVREYLQSPCFVENGIVLSEIGRPIAPCEVCRNLTRVQVYDTISPAEFVARHAYTIRPVLITGATANWTAMSTFTFDYFKELYESNPDGLAAVDEECQFFPYNTEFSSLEEAFQMSADRAALKQGEKHWYFGWSNCDPLIATELRKHYQRPYFLPASSESSVLDWIFMGGPGRGANIHLDSVNHPSWQAQLSGKKTWTLIPLPECEDICHTLQVTVNTGDIIVLDTNQWYHTTKIHPGQISITIGSEYD